MFFDVIDHHGCGYSVLCEAHGTERGGSEMSLGLLTPSRLLIPGAPWCVGHLVDLVDPKKWSARLLASAMRWR